MANIRKREAETKHEVRVDKNDKITNGRKKKPFKVCVQLKIHSTVDKSSTTGTYLILEEEKMNKSYFALIFSLK